MFWIREKGANLLGYVLLIALVAMLAFIGFSRLGDGAENKMDMAESAQLSLAAEEQEADSAISTPSFTPTPGQSALDQAFGPDEFPSGYNPLTGQPLCVPQAVDWAVVGISISQFPPGPTRPPTGLSWAAWVTEWWIGQGETRLYAMFYGCYPELAPLQAQGPGGKLPQLEQTQYVISDSAWYDANGNSMQDEGEPGLPNVTVTLFLGSEEVTSTMTDAGGKYFLIFDPQFGVSYRLQFKLPGSLTENYAVVQPNEGEESVDSDADPNTGYTDFFTLPEDQSSISDLDIGVRQSLRVSGIRSGRIVFETWRKFFEACNIIEGADPVVKQHLVQCASAIVADPHDIGSAGVDIARLKKIADQNVGRYGPPNLTGNLFDPSIPPGGTPAQTLNMFYNINNQTQWQFDSETGAYMRFQNTYLAPDVLEASTDRITGEPLGFENIILLFVPHVQLNHEGTIFDANFGFNTGEAKLFRDGKVYDIFWSTVNGPYEKETGRLRPIRFVDVQGNPFPLKPGSLWIHMMHTASEFWEPDPGSGIWRARWYSPTFQ